MTSYLRRLYLYALALAVGEVNSDKLYGSVNEHEDHYLVLLQVKVPKEDISLSEVQGRSLNMKAPG